MSNDQENKQSEQISGAAAAARARRTPLAGTESAAKVEAGSEAEDQGAAAENSASALKAAAFKNGYYLYKFQPVGVRAYNTSVRSIAVQVPGVGDRFKIKTIVVKLGVHAIPISDWKLLEQDPGAEVLIFDKSLMRIGEPHLLPSGEWTDGRNLATDVMDVMGVFQPVTVKAVIPLIFSVELLEIAMNHLELEGFARSGGSKELYDLFRDRIEALKTDGVNLLRPLPQHPDHNSNQGYATVI